MAAWGWIKRQMQILDYLYKNGETQEAQTLKAHIKAQLKKFKEVYE